MLQLDLSIIIIVFAALGFFTMGYFVGRAGKAGRTIIYKSDYTEELKNLPTGQSSKYVKTVLDNYPSDGIRAINEPSGVVMRPTAKELKKMNEDEITKKAKEEVAKAFKEEPVL
jgi:hypothetical protein